MSTTPPERDRPASDPNNEPDLPAPDPAAAQLHVGMLAEQLFGPVPGGVGRYVSALADALDETGVVRLQLITGRHHPDDLVRAGLDPARTTTLGLPGRVLARTWLRLRWPSLPQHLTNQLDLVHATSALIPPVGRRPLVVTVHDLAFRHHPEAYPPRGRAWHERSAQLTAAHANRILVPSAATARDLTGLYGVEPDRIDVIPLGTTTATPDLDGTRRLLTRLGVTGPFLMAVGTLEPRKNLPRLVAAFAQATEALPDHRLVVVGPTGWGPELVVPEAVADRVTLAGRVPEEVLHGLYELADALAYPSLYEGFGLPVLEAMAHGTPVLTSNRSSLPEVVGDAALLVDPDDTTAIAEGLVRLVDDRRLRARLTVMGPRRAAGFSWAATATSTEQAYLRAVRG